MFKPCVVIPVYNHERHLSSLLDGIRSHALPCLVVDDGSGSPCREELQRLRAVEAGWVSLLHHARNRGKGAAVVTGFRHAAAQGCTHVLQIDADGQHRTQDIPRFLAAARQSPEAVVAGAAVFDCSVPKRRRYGRYLSHVWVWINTLSTDINDCMCGFRVYPLGPVMRLLDRGRLGERMEFDIEIAVRLHWAGTPFVNVPTAVTYPADGVSHFRLWQDNARISKTHARLLLGMLRRLPHRLVRCGKPA